MNNKPLLVIPVHYFKNLYLKDMNQPPSNLTRSCHRIDPVESCAIWKHVQGLFWFAVGGDIAWLEYVVFYQQYIVHDSDLTRWSIWATSITVQKCFWDFKYLTLKNNPYKKYLYLFLWCHNGEFTTVSVCFMSQLYITSLSSKSNFS